ncbi:hypothetical protein EKO27_g7649 [Xylaria grammica]|uniref:HIT-type domain-containing protein n=1 Tax=Xylaria grammica TaxID=363999 RepID=A0A439CZB8_9PEZI|nr:hypothetical protein EKO27_g7649 [Xylaria grammica]
MNNFGVIEIASAKTTNAPGWAYVPDRQQQQHLIPAGTTNRKRARAAASGGAQLSFADANARQEAKARRDIDALDRDNAREVQIAIPAKPKGARAGGGKKFTPNVRKILQSQKTFTNHLDDYIALQSQQDANPTPTPAPSAANSGNANSRSAQRQASTSKRPSAKLEPEPEPEDIEMPDASEAPQSTILTRHAPPPPHAEDGNPLLASRLPPLPSDDELCALLAAPPLSYLEARGTWPPTTGGHEQAYPTRVFCAICGYWGRVRCMKCGTRVCALDCLETHQQGCITRYGL